MKTYYEILEVDRKATKEVIEKAYRKLAKKYHPDLQSNSERAKYGDIMAEINEAYSVLSNKEKREEYDQELEFDKLDNVEEIVKDKTINIKEEIINLREDLNKISGYKVEIPEDKLYRASVMSDEEYYKVLVKEVNRARQQAFHDAYVQDVRSRENNVTVAETLSEKTKRLGISIAFFIGGLVLLKIIIQIIYGSSLGLI